MPDPYLYEGGCKNSVEMTRHVHHLPEYTSFQMEAPDITEVKLIGLYLSILLLRY